jgi:multidrug resistance efflux pump
MNKAEDRNLPPSGNGSPTLKDRVRSLRLPDRGGGEARSPRSLLPWALCVVLLATTAAFGFRAYRGPAAAPGGADKARPNPAVAAAGDVVLQAKGYVVAVHPVQVSPKVGGMLVSVHPNLEEGRIFKEGDELARVEDVDYKAERDQAKSALEAAKARWAQKKAEVAMWAKQLRASEADAHAAAARLKKNQVIATRARWAKSAVTSLERDTAEAEVVSADADLESARARVEAKRAEKDSVEQNERAAKADRDQAKAALDKAEWRLDNCVVRAPVTGTILSKKAERGNIVNPAAFSSGISASLCDMADLRDIEIDLSIQERDIAQVQEKQECLVMPEAYQNDKGFLAKHPQGYVGFVSRLMPTADRAKGAIPVRVRIRREDIPPDEAGKYLRPDMGALVSFKRVGKK